MRDTPGLTVTLLLLALLTRTRLLLVRRHAQAARLTLPPEMSLAPLPLGTVLQPQDTLGLTVTLLLLALLTRTRQLQALLHVIRVLAIQILPA
jgi:hypothetical protein